MEHEKELSSTPLTKRVRTILNQHITTMLGVLIFTLCLGLIMADLSPSTNSQISALSNIQTTITPTSTQSNFPTRTLFLPGFSSSYYGSIVIAAPDATVYSLACMNWLCAGLSSTGIFTQGPSTYTYAVGAWAYTNM